MEHNVKINETVQMLKNTVDVVLEHPALNPHSLKLVVYSDAWLANRKDLSSLLGYVILLADNNGKMGFLSFRSCKNNCASRIAMAAETLAFAAAFEAAIVIRH